MKVSDMTNEQLNHYAALAQGWEMKRTTVGTLRWWSGNVFEASDYTPTTDWQQCGELIEKFKIFPNYCNYRNQYSGCYYSHGSPRYIYATDPRTALCRAVVASEFGEEVSDA